MFQRLYASLLCHKYRLDEILISTFGLLRLGQQFPQLYLTILEMSWISYQRQWHCTLVTINKRLYEIQYSHIHRSQELSLLGSSLVVWCYYLRCCCRCSLLLLLLLLWLRENKNKTKGRKILSCFYRADYDAFSKRRCCVEKCMESSDRHHRQGSEKLLTKKLNEPSFTTNIEQHVLLNNINLTEQVNYEWLFLKFNKS